MIWWFAFVNVYCYNTRRDLNLTKELSDGMARWRGAFDHGWDATRLNASFDRLHELEVRNDVMIVLEATNPSWFDFRTGDARLIAAGAAFARLENRSFDHADEVRADLEARIVQSLVEPMLRAIEGDVELAFKSDDGFDEYYLDFLWRRSRVPEPSTHSHNVTMESLKATREWALEMFERSDEWLKKVKEVHAKRMKKYGV